MLRNLLLISALILMAGAAGAQPVLSTRHIPSITDFNHADPMHVATGFIALDANDPLLHPGTGNGQVWNLNIEADTAKTVFAVSNQWYSSPADTSCFSGPYRYMRIAAPVVFPAIGWISPAGALSHSVLYQLRSDAVCLSRFENTVQTPYRCSPPLPHIVYGMSLGDSHVDSTQVSTFDCPAGPGYEHVWYDTVLYAGYGRLSVNGGTAVSAILIQHKRTDYMYQTSNPPMLYAPMITYDWIDASNGIPLLSYETYLPLPGQTTPTYRWNIYFSGAHFPARAASPTAVKPTAHGVVLSPNPVGTMLRVQGLQAAHVRVRTPTGSETLLPVQNGAVDVSALAPGLYVLDAQISGEPPQRFIKE